MWMRAAIFSEVRKSIMILGSNNMVEQLRLRKYFLKILKKIEDEELINQHFNFVFCNDTCSNYQEGLNLLEAAMALHQTLVERFQNTSNSYKITYLNKESQL